MRYRMTLLHVSKYRCRSRWLLVFCRRISLYKKLVTRPPWKTSTRLRSSLMRKKRSWKRCRLNMIRRWARNRSALHLYVFEICLCHHFASLTFTCISFHTSQLIIITNSIFTVHHFLTVSLQAQNLYFFHKSFQSSNTNTRPSYWLHVLVFFFSFWFL